MLADWVHRLRSLLRRERVEQELDEELRFHLQQQIESHIQAGLSRDAAERRARLDFGTLDLAKEEHRDARGVRPIEDFARDLRYAARQLRRAPGFTIVALLALALGIGATITVFTIVNAVLLRPLPFDRAHELYRVAKLSASGNDEWLSVPEFTRWQEGNHTGVSLAAFTPMDFNLRGVNPEGLIVVWASRSFLPVLGITPQLGRSFTESDFESGAERTALLSHEMWQRRYGGNPDIVGSHVDLEGPPFLSDSNGRYTIIGVLPERFWLFYSRTDFVIPMRASATQLNDPTERLVATIVARLSGAHPEAVRSDLADVSRRVAQESSRRQGQLVSIELTPLRDWHFGDFQRPLLLLMTAALLVALTACVNVALILMARTSYRERELAVRLAIGAGRGRVIRQLLTESVLVSVLGGFLGVCLAVGASRLVASVIPRNIVGRLPAGLDSLSLDFQVVVVAIGLSVLFGLLSGLASVAASRVTSSLGLLRPTTLQTLPAGRQTVQALLVVAQTAAAVVLLIVGGLLFRSLVRMNEVDLGIAPRQGLVVWLNMNLSRYPREQDRVRFYDAVFERLRSQPEVTHASGVDLPFHFEWQTTQFAPDSHKAEDPAQWPEALARSVTPTYFERHGIRLVHGRWFTARDDVRASAVSIVSQAIADRYWPGRSAIGQHVTTQTASGRRISSTIVGVVTDIRSAPRAQPQSIIYRPVQQKPPPWMYITVEGDATRSELLPAIRRAVWAVDPDQPLDGPSGPWTLERWLSERTEHPRLVAAIGNVLAAVALVLATIGLYGLLSYSVARRTSEFGVRMALGANAASVVALVLHRTFKLTALGVVLGLCTAALTTRLLDSMLFGVTPLDPTTFSVAGLLFLAISALASLVPLRRALRVSPLVALRND